MNDEITDTPRTDAAFGQGKHGVMITPYETSCKLERELTAAKQEVERRTNALIDCLHITNCYDGNYARACDNVTLIVTNALKPKPTA
jgi:hypothetical protein